MKPSEIAKLDKLASVFCRNRPWKCEACGNGGPPYHAAHAMVGRKVQATRWCQGNLNKLCPKCHAHFHDRPFAHGQWLNKFWGDAHSKMVEEMGRMLAPDIKPRLTFEEVKGMIEADTDTWYKRIKGV